ncbi:hypothetical protein BDV23DRAFT_162726 [Aspergillus alliaceus]|uniref:Uncharacterized protein n=1 Tax=Petromyces alliaceus TaxID=209559 RepID=A0A5N7BZ30_PETAA|nr:hypothetical protein BDV23DRAFT_162726 [Aspergillus alliaceus]
MNLGRNMVPYVLALTYPELIPWVGISSFWMQRCYRSHERNITVLWYSGHGSEIGGRGKRERSAV